MLQVNKTPEIATTQKPRPRGAPPGNQNRLVHGRFSTLNPPAKRPKSTPTPLRPEDQALLESFERYLHYLGKEPQTIAHYTGATRQWFAYCRDENIADVLSVSHRDIRGWQLSLTDHYAEASIKNRIMGCKMFYNFCVEEEIIEAAAHPLRGRKLPKVHPTLKDIVTPEDMERMFAHLEKAKRWRDAAVIAIFYDTGMRATELVTLRTENVNLRDGIAVLVRTKNDEIRAVHFGSLTMRYLDRYLRHQPAFDYLICGKQGAMSREGVYLLVKRCFMEIGVPNIGPHDLRHTSATHVALERGMSTAEMQTLYGWKDVKMAQHYTRQASKAIAIAAHKEHGPLDRLRAGAKPRTARLPAPGKKKSA